MDEYSTDLDLYESDAVIEPWWDEESVSTVGMPSQLWHDGDLTRAPPEPPKWIDELANEVEIQRLCEMGVLVKQANFAEKVTDKLTTKFVYDWRVKDYDGPTGPVKRWLRRSRLVGREYAFLQKRDDTYSPATSTHTMNLLPLLYLQKSAESFDDGSGVCGAEWGLGTVDVKDAFSMVDQPKPFSVQLQGPGQRLGAKAWYWHLRTCVTESLKLEWRNDNCCIMVHVDIMYTGSKDYWEKTFLPTIPKQVHHQLFSAWWCRQQDFLRGALFGWKMVYI